ncbi:hypothetical protein ACFX2I_011390 [Malus domestica]
MSQRGASAADLRIDDLGEGELMDQMIGIVRLLRLKLPIQDRLMKMKIIKNCFAGSEMVEVLTRDLGIYPN